MGSPRVRRRRPKVLRTGHAYEDIAALLADVKPKGRCLDLPAGTGVNIDGIRRAGFEPVAADLFPEKAAGKGAECVRVDFTQPLPFADGSFAAVLCSEGIEHSPNQLQLVREFARVLRPGGALLITTPNVLNLRARLTYLLTGHPATACLPISEASHVRAVSPQGGIYIHHVFLISYFALRFLLKLAGFGEIRVTTAKYSPTAIALAPVLWLPVRLATGRLVARLRRAGHPDIAAELISHVMSADMLLGKKLILLARKKG
ncbi:MAG TPA: class I SAM-dependent methyltransferase [Planctomycetota bacterium]|nr:class I SAM-dependent methyltransferase [Planctomycetota bacterium]